MTLSDYLALFPGASRGKPRFMALAEAVLRQAADLAALIESIPAAFSAAEAEGVQLDSIAEAVGLSRQDCNDGEDTTDGDFRAYLREKLTLWTWNGTNEDVPRVLALALADVTETDNMDGTVTVTAPAGSGPVSPEQAAPVTAGTAVILRQA